MFDRYRSKNVIAIKNINFKALKKMGAVIISSSLLMPGLSIAEPPSCLYGEQLAERNRIIEEFRKDYKNYNTDFYDIYSFANVKVGDKEISLQRIYLAYGYDDNNNAVYYLVAPKLGNFSIIDNSTYNLKDIDLIPLRDLSLFVNMLDNGFVKVDNNVLEFSSDINMFNQLIEDWDGYMQTLVPETMFVKEKINYKLRGN